MQTSAQRPTTDSQAQPAFVYTGTVLRPAEARTAICDREGHAVPVVSFDMELDTLLKTQMHVEQPFPRGNFAAAQAAAHRLKKGTRVTVVHPADTVRIVGNATTNVHVIKDDESHHHHSPQEHPASWQA